MNRVRPFLLLDLWTMRHVLLEWWGDMIWSAKKTILRHKFFKHPFPHRLRSENLLKVKQFIAQLLEPRPTDLENVKQPNDIEEIPQVADGSEDGPIGKHMESSQIENSIKGKGFGNLEKSEIKISGQEVKGEETKECNCIDLDFTDKKSRQFHISRIHLNMDGCQLCKRAFSSSDNFKEHMRSHHGRDCKCQNILEMDEKQVLFHNQTIHRKHFGCNICYRTFRKKAHGLAHMAEHNGERGFQCDKCGNDYKRAGDLKSHTKLCLDLEDPVKCDLCEKHFKGKQRLKLHRRRFHVDLRQCPYCPAQVSLKIMSEMWENALLRWRTWPGTLFKLTWRKRSFPVLNVQKVLLRRKNWKPM